MTFIAGMLNRWMAWVLPRPRLVLGVAFLTALLALYTAVTRLEIKTDQLELISTDHPLIELTDQLDPFIFDGKRTFTLVIKAPTPEQGISFVKLLAPRIKEDTAHFKEVLYRVDPDLVKKWALLYLDREDLLQVGARIREHSTLVNRLAEDPDLLTFLQLVNQEMATRMVGELFTGFLGPRDGKPDSEEEPMDLAFLIKTLEGLSGYLHGSVKYESPWSSFFKSEAWDLEQEGYFWEGNKQFLIMIVVPRKGTDGFTATQTSLDSLREHIREVRALFPDVQAGVTGQEALNNDEMTTVLGDMTRATWLSLLGVLALMSLFWRSIRRPLAETISLTVGLCWTFGCASLFVGHLNILSVVFAPLLCGLGVDYGIHWYARFEEEEQLHPSFDNRTLARRVIERSGTGIFLAGLSAAFCFLPFLLTGFVGLMELGLITGLGILVNMVADFSVLPCASIYLAGRRKVKASAGADREKDILRLNPFTAGGVLAGGILLCAVSAWGISQVRFDLNPLRLQAKNAESVIWEKILIENSEHSLLSAASFAQSAEEALSRSDRLKALPSVAEVRNVFTLLPENQEAKIPILRALAPEIPEISRAVQGTRPSYMAELKDVLERIRFKMQEDQADQWGADRPLIEQMARVRTLAGEIIGCLNGYTEEPALLFDYRERFREDLVDTWSFLKEGASAPLMEIENIPEIVRNQFYRDGKFLLRIFPRESIWEAHALSEFVRDIQGVDPNVVGDPVSLYVFAEAYKKACVNASIYALIFIFGLLLVTFRDTWIAFMALIPLGVGSLWTVGIMGLAGINFNLANSIFMPLIVGAGVEYGIIILQRWKDGLMRPGHLPFSTGKGVILAALTTTVGFGTLMISEHQGIFSLGFVAWAGSLCVMTSAIALLPAMLAYMRPPVYIPVKEIKNESTVLCGSVDCSLAADGCRSVEGTETKCHR